MSTDATRSGENASMAGGQSEDAVVEALGHILTRSEAARSALASTLREGGTAVEALADVRSLDIGVAGKRPGFAGYDGDGVARVLIQAMCWTDLTPNQPNGYFKRLPLDRPAALLFVAPATRLAALWPELCRRADEQFTIIGATTPGDLRAATVSGGERRLMLTSWTALLELIERMVNAAGDAETDIRQPIGQLRGRIDRMDADN